ncbi:VanZ family protein [Marinobacter sp. JSM 1782161]|uniref:VanZ family protein n=1 Tax=Marinobacter sp. JSM 1782161 TaxID=2685906 RepID=UPI001402E749|nr:VanZ family protein [Marinobacter sp. JSM 1782161]
MTDLLRKLTQQTRLWRVALLVSMTAILWLATSDLDQPIQVSSWDKLNHVTAFVALTLLLRLGWPRLGVAASVAVLLGYGLFIELCQAPLPYRSFSLLDLVADGVGIAAGLALWFLTVRRLSDNT